MQNSSDVRLSARRQGRNQSFWCTGDSAIKCGSKEDQQRHQNPAAVQVTVLSIAALKKVSRGTRILLLDRNGGQAKSIAKALAKKGFKRGRPADSSGSLLSAMVSSSRTDRRASCQCALQTSLAPCVVLCSSPYAVMGQLDANEIRWPSE